MSYPEGHSQKKKIMSDSHLVSNRFVESIDEAVDVFSIHFYYEDAHRGETRVEILTEPSKLDKFLVATGIFSEVVKNYSAPSSKAKMWFGESGLFPGSHNAVNISDRFISGMV